MSGGFLRTIPIRESIPVTRNIAVYDDAVEILKKQKLIVITDCICRKMRETVETGCGKPMEACFMFGSMGQYYLDHNMGRQIDVEEGSRILRQAHDAGLVTQPARARSHANSLILAKAPRASHPDNKLSGPPKDWIRIPFKRRKMGKAQRRTRLACRTGPWYSS